MHLAKQSLRKTYSGESFILCYPSSNYLLLSPALKAIKGLFSDGIGSGLLMILLMAYTLLTYLGLLFPILNAMIVAPHITFTERPILTTCELYFLFY